MRENSVCVDLFGAQSRPRELRKITSPRNDTGVEYVWCSHSEMGRRYEVLAVAGLSESSVNRGKFVTLHVNSVA